MPEAQAQPPIAFIDIEASGLGPHSWPIEVGWVFETGDAHALLVKPADQWSMKAWEKSAEALHRITPNRLITEGRDPLETALILNAAIGSATVYSDAPDYDSFWLFRLYDAAGIKPNYILNDIGDLLRPIWPREPKELVALASDEKPHAHRAAADVLHLQAMYRIACDAFVQERPNPTPQ
ncbi:hypothetical protein PB2503_09839 [Parvularcula bermudensis HTCC2503]|uniref:Exonuclease domain-containing protein n=1 Tax=Parvularcula bermudensis (strain ATCC BAA-594 / HTCC2503 / KCTC 12087) TaxID=314260 RepID=E0TED4_PARBH|nr:hypothetical protein [Parvularcula bermudensis]ADM10020.1 hypothetical protein PB2503_09839 [Parvularcula bermudensis HTCC2503]